ncbi:ABC transporter permease subunit [Sciscionella marina]|uniref:ABC transporter permease n=1 Tax=Sciscionella marina TaxID=508770 RepID=UPI00036B2700
MNQFFEFVGQRWGSLLFDLYQHGSLVLQCTVLAVVIGVGIGIAVYSSPGGSAIATALTSAILTIPSFALFGLFIPVLGLGVQPAVITLTLYALLPIVRNTIVGLANIDPAVTGAARGIGMHRLGVLTRIELRLAWPSILAGTRVSVQMLMGIAAIAAFAKGPGLGGSIFSGLAAIGSKTAVDRALAGTIGIVVLALVVDGLLVLLGRFTTSPGVRARA